MTWFNFKQSATLTWIFALTLGGKVSCSPDSAMSFNLTESEYLSLEGGSLYPHPDIVAKVEKEVALIRAKYSAIQEIKHNRKWIPGQILTTKINKEQLAQVNSSAYGPLRSVERIDVMPFFFVTVLTFDKPYSPPVLSKMLQSEFDFPCSPNSVYYEYEVDDIAYRMANSTYVFKKGTGNCKENCSDRYLWEFQIDESGDPNLMKQWVVPQNGERVVIYRK